MFFDGGILYSPYGGQTYGQATSFTTSAPYAEGDTFDHCGGHSATTADASFHYHVPPVCLLRQLGAAEGVPSPQVGWAFDGFPVYGPLGPGGTQMKTCTVTGGTFGTDVCTDDCTGYYGDTGDGFMYRYYMLGGYNDGECCTAPYQPDQGGGADYYPFTNNCFNGCCPSGVTCDGFGFSLPACSSSAEDGTSSSFEAVTQDALAVNGDSCAAADVCCDGSYTDKCPPASCDTCVTTFPALPTPEPTTPAPTPPPAVAVTLALGMSGIACDAYGAAEEAAVNTALEASIPGTDASASFSAHTCADVARRLRDSGRRRLMTAATTTVEIGTTASIDVAAARRRAGRRLGRRRGRRDVGPADGRPATGRPARRRHGGGSAGAATPRRFAAQLAQRRLGRLGRNDGCADGRADGRADADAVCPARTAPPSDLIATVQRFARERLRLPRAFVGQVRGGCACARHVSLPPLLGVYNCTPPVGGLDGRRDAAGAGCLAGAMLGRRDAHRSASRSVCWSA